MDLRLASVLLLSIYNIYAAPSNQTESENSYNNYATCPAEQYSLDITCGDSYVTYMRNVEKQLIESNDFEDPTSCLYHENENIEEVDFIVIGAGVTGGVVAGRLSEAKDWQVALLEAGPAAPAGSQAPSMYFNYKGDPEYDWNYQLLPQGNVCLNQNGICVYPRGKVMGGTGILHGMMYMRGNPDDYNILINDGITGWSYDEVMPYFLKSENNLDINASWIEKSYHRTGGALTISRFNDHPAFAEDLLKAWHELGYDTNVDLNGHSQLGFMIAQATTINGEREATTKAYVYPHLKERKNLIVMPKATVYNIIINNETMTAEGVMYERNGKQKILKAKKEVVVTAGTIASPQLLMLSGLGPKEDLEAVEVNVIRDMPGVGQNLNNHASTEIFFRIGSDFYTQPLNEDTLSEFLNERKGPMTSTGLSQVTGFIRTNESDPDPRPDIQIFHAGFMANCSKTGLLGETVEPGHRMFSISPTLLNAKSVGYVKLRDQYPTSKPIIYGGLLTVQDDIDRLLAGINITMKMVKTNAMQYKNVYLDPSPLQGCTNLTTGSYEYWLCYLAHKTNPENHQVGTCRMGAVDNPKAVTDSELRVIGIKNLRVADASVFPRTPSGNLQGPAIMVAERAASFINDTWRTSDTEYYPHV